MSTLSKSLLWDVTDQCNLRCTHCYNADKYFHRKDRPGGIKRLDTTEALYVVEKIAQAGFQHIHLLGGEPLCREDLFEIIEHARNHELRVTINTNGTGLTREKNTRLVDLGVSQVTISLDGVDPETNDKIRGKGVFELVTSNIRTLANQVSASYSDLMVSIAFVMIRSNIASIVELPALAHRLGAGLVDLMWLYECGNAQTNVLKLQPGFDLPQQMLEKAIQDEWQRYPQIKLQLDTRPRLAAYLSRKFGVRIIVNPFIHRCVAGDHTWLLEADGHIHPCGSLSTPFADKVHESGKVPKAWINVRDIGDFNELSSTEYWRRFLEFREAPETYAGIRTCKNCEHNHYCKPCPILHFNKDEVEECLWVEKKEKELLKLAANAVPTIKDRLSVSIADGNVNVWDSQFQRSRNLNHTAEEVLRMVNGRLSCGDIACALAEKYRNDAVPQHVQRDVINFQLDLRTRGILDFGIRFH